MSINVLSNPSEYLFIDIQIIQSRAGPSSTLGFSPDMSLGYPPLHPSQSALIQAHLPVMGDNADFIRRTLSSQFTPMTGGFKEPNQVFLFIFFFFLVQTLCMCVCLCSIKWLIHCEGL